MKKTEARKLQSKIAAMKKALGAAFDLMGDDEVGESHMEEDLRQTLHLLNSGLRDAEETLTALSA